MSTNVQFSMIQPNQPRIDQSDELSVSGTVGALPYWAVCIEASQSVRELLNLLDKNVHVPGVLVLENRKLVGLIPREKVYEKLGRPFGIELFFKNDNKSFYGMLKISTLVLSSDTFIDDAVKTALARDAQTLYEPIVVIHPNAYRVVSMYNLLMAQQDTLRDLYTEVRYLSTKDPLTLVNNRRGFFDTIAQRLTTIRQFDLEYAVLMIDFDNFKNVNDRYGHQVGDMVIQAIATRINEHLREKDVLGRFGGEEFVVFLMDIESELALAQAEKLRQDIASIFHTVNGFQIRVTISIGVSHSRRANAIFERVLSEADKALFAAKNTGRNNVVLWKDNLVEIPHELKVSRIVREGSENHSGHLAEQTLEGMLRLLYLRDYETEAHTMRVSEIALKLAGKLGIPVEDHEDLRIGALLHDIGKIAIPDKILFKPEKLTRAEWQIMQKHPQYAHDLISPISYFQRAVDIPLCHHEHWNGSGYPRALRGEEIPLAARIFTIVDVWDALSSDRPYRPAWKRATIIEYIQKQTGVMFDPALVPVFLENLDTFE